MIGSDARNTHFAPRPIRSLMARSRRHQTGEASSICDSLDIRSQTAAPAIAARDPASMTEVPSVCGPPDTQRLLPLLVRSTQVSTGAYGLGLLHTNMLVYFNGRSHHDALAARTASLRFKSEA